MPLCVKKLALICKKYLYSEETLTLILTLTVTLTLTSYPNPNPNSNPKLHPVFTDKGHWPSIRTVRASDAPTPLQ